MNREPVVALPRSHFLARRAALSASSLLLVALVVGCATTNTVVRPNTDLHKYKRVAILPFQTNLGDGNAMADAFVTQFMAAGFSVVERLQIEAIFKELGLSYTGVLSQQEVKEIGKIAHVDALVFGSTAVERFYKPAEAVLDKDGTYVSVGASSELRTGSVSLRMVDVETGEVVLTSTLENGGVLGSYWPPNKIPRRCMPRHMSLSSSEDVCQDI